MSYSQVRLFWHIPAAQLVEVLLSSARGGDALRNQEMIVFYCKKRYMFLQQVNNQRGYFLWRNQEFCSRYYGKVN
jgi:CHASE3 domain sensor protein